jgi:arginine deiminase
VLLAPDFLAQTTTFSYRPSDHPSGVEFHAEKKPFVDVVAQALGLKKLNRIVERPDTPAFRGMVLKVPHLLRIVE